MKCEITSRTLNKYSFEVYVASYELKDKVTKYVNKKVVEHNIIGIEFTKNNKCLEITLINDILNNKSVKYLENNIPKWIETLCKKDVKEKNENKKFSERFVNTYKLPEVGIRFKKELEIFRGVLFKYLQEVYESIEKNDYEMATMYAADLKDLTKIFLAVKSNNIGYAKAFCMKIDTSPRESIPNCVYNGIIFND